MSLFEGLDIDAIEPSEKEKEYYKKKNNMSYEQLYSDGDIGSWNRVLSAVSEGKWKIW